ncbi:hypothetical protein LLH03_15590 [bacterium]|nr:hypothetical protein [bacterium]
MRRHLTWIVAGLLISFVCVVASAETVESWKEKGKVMLYVGANHVRRDGVVDEDQRAIHSFRLTLPKGAPSAAGDQETMAPWTATIAGPTVTWVAPQDGYGDILWDSGRYGLWFKAGGVKTATWATYDEDGQLIAEGAIDFRLGY